MLKNKNAKKVIEILIEMEKYSEADIAKIINDCEILILPENTSFDDVITNEIEDLFECNQNSNENVRQSVKEPEIEETEEVFEQIYQNSKENQNNEVIVSLIMVFQRHYLLTFLFF